MEKDDGPKGYFIIDLRNLALSEEILSKIEQDINNIVVKQVEDNIDLQGISFLSPGPIFGMIVK